MFSYFWEWNQVNELIFQLDIILEGINKSKKLWDKRLLQEMEDGANIMIKGQDNVHGEDEIAIFLKEWFETMGKVFLNTKPSINEKKEFINKIYQWIDKDDYGLDNSFENALFVICNTKQDLDLIKEINAQELIPYLFSIIRLKSNKIICARVTGGTAPYGEVTSQNTCARISKMLNKYLIPIYTEHPELFQ